ncbi:hypothetical protein METBIDRAFT_30352 [Metschnikowia bicuspidata var. bicuspidata NRRL YB-4993]|uniref:Uncharacterized protein n=1 Tax=Metschnikowia bicuspidata var. bicuspidata NRRL YB-4993 TaxID=869754 RepID=A0A1A0HIL8_9ASCO|nr:hypothetical protein METBIDRAFT_30352 [Metschnikowia bicuspidata var. bicuspidata NRRL YB-4993]OBA23999.1 hypothetical protein METBIDRAFT_30352 [Metschnikowia bicuspidata var. bicuspidata NRRL YB-4993]
MKSQDLIVLAASVVSISGMFTPGKGNPALGSLEIPEEKPFPKESLHPDLEEVPPPIKRPDSPPRNPFGQHDSKPNGELFQDWSQGPSKPETQEHEYQDIRYGGYGNPPKS